MRRGVTPRRTLARDGCSRLLAFEADAGERPAVLVVPSLIGRWHIVDLRPQSSLVGALVAAGFRVYAIDWGAPREWDRYLSWEDLVSRIRRMLRWVSRHSGTRAPGLIGYSVGGTLSTITTALRPDKVGALVNLAGPIDFDKGGLARLLTDPRWFDVEALTDAGNVAASQMWAGTVALRPTAHLGRWLGPLRRGIDRETVKDALRLEDWVNASVSFPAKAYERYIRELYQQNTLIQGRHTVRGRAIALGDIECPVMAITFSHDQVCPPEATQALLDHVGSQTRSHLGITGGHVGAVIGDRAPGELHAPLIDWLQTHM